MRTIGRRTSPPAQPRLTAESLLMDTAAVLIEAARRLPGRVSRPGRFPLLNALSEQAADLARRLLLAAALFHPHCDERSMAEQLLRDRRRARPDELIMERLVASARDAVNADGRRSRRREIPTATSAFDARSGRTMEALDAAPSIGEIALDKVRTFTRIEPTALTADRLLNAVATVMELAERHARNLGHGPSVLAMRADARKSSRLVTYLRAEFDDDVAASAIARLLLGGDGTSIETGLLWWCARRAVQASDVSEVTRSRWIRDLVMANQASEQRTGRKQMAQNVDKRRTRAFHA